MIQNQISYPYPDYPVCLSTFYAADGNLHSKCHCGDYHSYCHCIDFHSHCQWHEDLEILLVETGTVPIQVADQKLILNAGQGLFINQNTIHALQDPANQSFTVSCMHFRVDFILPQSQGSLAEQYLNPVLQASCMQFLLLDPEDKNTADMLLLAKQLFRTYQSHVLGRELDVKALLCRFWKKMVILCRKGKMPDNPNVSIYDGQRIKVALKFIGENYARPLTLDDIAASIHTSNSECCRCFKRVLNVTPFEYLLRYRVFEAAALLQTDEAAMGTISDLAASVGFNSPSYFNKKFKQYLHCTPREYRSTHLKA